MTLEIGDGVSVKTWWDNMVQIHTEKKDSVVTLKDFCAAAYYVLVNADLLDDNDPRVDFVRLVKRLVQTPGYDETKKRLVFFSASGCEGHSLAYPGAFPNETEKLKETSGEH